MHDDKADLPCIGCRQDKYEGPDEKAVKSNFRLQVAVL
jgi:hypothetical protein